VDLETCTISLIFGHLLPRAENGGNDGKQLDGELLVSLMHSSIRGTERFGCSNRSKLMRAVPFHGLVMETSWKHHVQRASEAYRDLVDADFNQG